MDRLDFAFVLALGLIVAGVAFIYWPAALISAGLMAACLAWFGDDDA